MRAVTPQERTYYTLAGIGLVAFYLGYVAFHVLVNTPFPPP